MMNNSTPINIDTTAFQSALPILKKLEEAGHEAYFVGGSVRDAILKRPINDIDIATSAYPQEVQGLFPHHFDVGLEHGTVLVLFNNESYEITTFRTESGYQDYRRPNEVKFVKELSEDLLRRDFTMNALALNKNFEIIDYFAGQEAIEHQQIVAVGNANDRFHEDALRMVRAIRFSGQLGFTIEKETLSGIRENAQLLEKIAIERILIEMNKLWLGKNWKQGIQFFISEHLIQFCPYTETLKEAFCSLINELSSAHTFINPQLAWALLLWYHTRGNTINERKMLKTWKMSNNDIKKILEYLSILNFRFKHTDYDALTLYKMDKAMVLDIEKKLSDEQQAHSSFGQLFSKAKVQNIQIMTQQLPIHSLQDLAINGKDIIKVFSPQDKRLIGKSIREAEVQVVIGALNNNKDEILTYLETKLF